MSTTGVGESGAGAFGSMLGRARSKVLASAITVTGVDWISPRLLRISADVPFPIEAGSHVALRVDGVGRSPLGTWRRYTIAAAVPTPSGCRIEVVAYIADHGPASPWLRGLRAGTEISMRAVEHPEPIADGWMRILCVGDETALGTFEALRTRADPAVVIDFVLQVHAADDAVIAGVDSSAIVHAPTGDAAPLATIVAERLDPTGGLIVLGQRSTVNQIRILANERGIGKHHRLLRPYWAVGRSGLE